jgi:rod shape determining protein RodA
MLSIDRRLIAHFDWPLLGLTLIIPCLGLVVLYSAGYDPDSMSRFNGWVPEFTQSPASAKQTIFLGIGFIAMLIGMSLSTNLLSKVSYVVYWICVILLLAVLVKGTVVNGSRRWLSFGGFNLQPAEPMKLGLILAMARYLSRNPPKRGGYGFLQLIMPALIVGLPVALIIDQPDLGSAMSVAGIGGIMIFFMGIQPRTLAIMISTALSGIYPAWLCLYPYQQRRVLTLFNPDADPLGSGYHIIQSKIAVGSGAFLGKGYFKGTQSQFEFLPEHTTDFVFSVLAEEWGFVGTIVVLLFYFLLLYRMLKVVQKSKDLFSSLIAFGIVSLLFFHTAINIGMVVGIFPVVGIPLPLFSYGGSSVLSSMFGIGIVMGVSMRRLLFSAGQ